MRTVYGIPPELQYNKVLFVEKRGFNTMLNESGTLDRFNMGVVGTQGYAPRAAKKLMEYLINRGISVYILHDCDLFGYNIHERIAEGSDTYPMPLQVTDIGLKVDDVKNKLPKLTLLNRDFSETLEQFTPDEARFFMPYSNVDGPPQDKIQAAPASPYLFSLLSTKQGGKKGVGFASRNSFPNCWYDYYSDSIVRSIINSLGMGCTFCIYWRNVPNHWISHPLTTIVERK